MGAPLDTIIIGAGTAGLAALREVRKRTDRYLIVNDGPLGHHVRSGGLHAFQDAHRGGQHVPPAPCLE